MNETERLATLEARMESFEKIFISRMDKMENKLDQWQHNYVPRTEIVEMFRSRDERMDSIEDNQKSNRQAITTWIAILISAGSFLYTILKR